MRGVIVLGGLCVNKSSFCNFFAKKGKFKGDFVKIIFLTA
jgi:hypothetical protein